jgi:hypothetical protein
LEFFWDLGFGFWDLPTLWILDLGASSLFWLNSFNQMKRDDQPPEPDPSGAGPPPRPPRRTAIGLGGPDDDDGNDDPGKDRPNEPVRINLPPYPSAVPTIKMPTITKPATKPVARRPWWKFWQS